MVHYLLPFQRSSFDQHENFYGDKALVDGLQKVDYSSRLSLRFDSENPHRCCKTVRISQFCENPWTLHSILTLILISWALSFSDQLCQKVRKSDLILGHLEVVEG